MSEFNHLKVFLESSYGKRCLAEEGITDEEKEYLVSLVPKYLEFFSFTVRPALDQYVLKHSQDILVLNGLNSKDGLYINSISMTEYSNSNEWEISYEIKGEDPIIHAYFQGMEVQGFGLTI